MTLYTKMHQNPSTLGSYGSIVNMMSCRIYIINSIEPLTKLWCLPSRWHRDGVALPSESAAFCFQGCGRAGFPVEPLLWNLEVSGFQAGWVTEASQTCYDIVLYCIVLCYVILYHTILD